MSRNTWSNVGVVILAAGRGTRLGSTDKPKVMLEIGSKPIVSYIVDTLFALGFNKEQVVLVVGFCKETVQSYFGGRVSYAVQEEQLGTAHAAYIGMQALPSNIEYVLVINGDDSAFYKPATLKGFVNASLNNPAEATVLTAESNNPDVGRIVITDKGQQRLVTIVEKEDLTEEQRSIRTISTGTFFIIKQWFLDNFSRIKKLKGLGELGLNSVFDLQNETGYPIRSFGLGYFQANDDEWFGINTTAELAEANERKENNL